VLRRCADAVGELDRFVDIDAVAVVSGAVCADGPGRAVVAPQSAGVRRFSAQAGMARIVCHNFWM
jgi:hypothetical protein